MTIRPCDDKQEWDDSVNDLGGHPLQLWGWGELKAAHNWQVQRVLYESPDGAIEGGAQILSRHLLWPFRNLYYLPRGPFGALADSQEGMNELTDYIRKQKHGVGIAAEPNQETVEWGSGWRRSSNTILIPRTLILDLSKSEEELLSAMTKKTRQYVRKSERDGVVIRRLRTPDEIAEALAIYHETADRAHFAIHDDRYYYDCAEQLGESSLILGAYYDGMLVSFVWSAVSAEMAFELYGGMNQRGQELRANYALKWHAIRKCKEWGIARYDMNGLLNDGVSAFKEGFSDHESMLAGTYDFPLSPLYMIWARLLPLGKRMIRTFKK
jgi:lipid II:glycine glycyltransferase (peptidoglycan interpeptide bridge formation enzyme)